MPIVWFSKTDSSGLATVYKTNITINKFGMNEIKDAAAGLLGMDVENKRVLIKPLTCDEVESGHYPKEAMFPFSGGDTYTRISSTEFVGAIAKAFGYDFKEGKKKFPCRFDAQEKSLIIDLSKEVTS